MEECDQTMLGSFELKGNAFKKECGIVVGSDGEIYLDLADVPDSSNHAKETPDHVNDDGEATDINKM